MTILAIETSCDETSIALVEAKDGLKNPRFKILKNLVSSQIKVHRPFGGVVPMLAKREHMKNLPIVLRRVLGVDFSKSNIKKQKAKTQTKNVKIFPDLIAVTVGPGLEPALWPGIEFAKTLTNNLQLTTNNKKIKLVGVNHLEGHLYSFLANSEFKSGKLSVVSGKLFPAIALIVSGGHTILLKMDSLTKYKKLGETRDDAAGEAFDKVAKMLGLPYPGGPEIEALAKKGDSKAINFPRPMINTKDYEFSFSGLKTAVLYYIRDANISILRSGATAEDGRMHTNDANKENGVYALIRANRRIDRADVAASFQQAVIDVLVKKTMRAAREFGAKSVILSGGVAMNKALQHNLQLTTNNLQLNFFVPLKKLLTDNAAMIGIAAYMNVLRKKKYRLTAQGNLSL